VDTVIWNIHKMRILFVDIRIMFLLSASTRLLCLLSAILILYNGIFRLSLGLYYIWSILKDFKNYLGFLWVCYPHTIKGKI
jgi:hypothetical protein